AVQTSLQLGCMGFSGLVAAADLAKSVGASKPARDQCMVQLTRFGVADGTSNAANPAAHFVTGDGSTASHALKVHARPAPGAGRTPGFTGGVRKCLDPCQAVAHAADGQGVGTGDLCSANGVV